MIRGRVGNWRNSCGNLSPKAVSRWISSACDIKSNAEFLVCTPSD